MAAVLDFAHCDSEPFRALYARFRKPLQRYFASHRLSAADVEDFSQEVFLRIAKSSLAASLRNADVFVFTLARNLMRDRARRLRTQPFAVPLEEVELFSDLATPEQALECDERLHSLAVALRGLKSTTQRAFLLNRLCGFSYAEIACKLSISVSMVEKHVMAAIAALRAANGESPKLGSHRRIMAAQKSRPASKHSGEKRLVRHDVPGDREALERSGPQTLVQPTGLPHNPLIRGGLRELRVAQG